MGLGLIFTQIANYFSNLGFLGYLELFAVVVGLSYVILQTMQKPSMWVFWFLTSVAYFIIYLDAKVYAMMLIQVYYMASSVYGFISWQKTKSLMYQHQQEIGEECSKNAIVIRPMERKLVVISSLIAVVVFILLSYIFTNYSENPNPIMDSFVATLCMLATYWLSRSYIQQWYVWIVANISSVLLFASTGLYLTSILYFAYFVICFIGIYSWKKNGKILKTK